jgi:hypothetical protein
LLLVDVPEVSKADVDDAPSLPLRGLPPTNKGTAGQSVCSYFPAAPLQLHMGQMIETRCRHTVRTRTEAIAAARAVVDDDVADALTIVAADKKSASKLGANARNGGVAMVVVWFFCAAPPFGANRRSSA